MTDNPHFLVSSPSGQRCTPLRADPRCSCSAASSPTPRTTPTTSPSLTKVQQTSCRSPSPRSARHRCSSWMAQNRFPSQPRSGSLPPAARRHALTSAGLGERRSRAPGPHSRQEETTPLPASCTTRSTASRCPRSLAAGQAKVWARSSSRARRARTCRSTSSWSGARGRGLIRGLLGEGTFLR